MMGSFSIALGLLLLGRRVLETLGKKVIILDYPKGYCVQFAAATAIMICQYLGIPVSATHCNVGALLGLGLATRLETVNDVYHERKVSAENKLNTRVIAKIVGFWILTVPLVFTCSVLFTNTLI